MMMTLKTKKNILLCISASISAYKAPNIVRELQKEGYKVKVLMTANATKFVSVLSLQALTMQTEPPYHDINDSNWSMSHISMAKWADTVLIAPATADMLSKIAHGDASNLVTATILACCCEVIIAPAMNCQMWSNVATKNNVEILHKNNVRVIPPATGELACGDYGTGRMAEINNIITTVNNSTYFNHTLANKRILITAGPTIEAIDPVRFISNKSSGKMGYAIARALRKTSAKVTLISGPTTLKVPSNVKTIKILSSAEMHEATLNNIIGHDIFIATAAVTDYKPCYESLVKIKKGDELETLNLKKTKDILRDISCNYNNVFTVGFAAESDINDDLIRDKMNYKQCDIIFANKISKQTAFNSDNNEL